MTCYRCDYKYECSVPKENLELAEQIDETEVYLVAHSCKHGCPKGYDKDIDSPCWDVEASPSEGEATT